MNDPKQPRCRADFAQGLDGDGSTAMHIAARRGREDAIHTLGLSNADLNARDAGGRTPAIVAAQAGSEGVLRILHEQFGVDLNTADNFGRAAGHYAAFQGELEVFRTLLRSGVDTSSADAQGRTPAHCAAFHGYDSILDELRPFGNLGAKDAEGRTPAHGAAIKGHVKTLRHLLNWRVDLNVLDSKGTSVAHLAAMHGHVGVLKLLREEGAREMLAVEDTSGRTPAHFGAETGQSLVLEELQDVADLEAEDRAGRRPIHLSAQNGHHPCLTCLIQFADKRSRLDGVELAVKLAAKDHEGKAAAHYAAQSGHTSVLRMLHSSSVRVAVIIFWVYTK